MSPLSLTLKMKVKYACETSVGFQRYILQDKTPHDHLCGYLKFYIYILPILVSLYLYFILLVLILLRTGNRFCGITLFIFDRLFTHLFYFMMLPQSSAEIKNGGAIFPLFRMYVWRGT
jgi:hypothetical protein